MCRHLNPHFHWCARCWDWVCDCVHCVEPLNIKRQPVTDIHICSVGYDRRRGRLEIEFTWTDDVRQFYPVSPDYDLWGRERRHRNKVRPRCGIPIFLRGFADSRAP
jgi:hypothetical protein